MSFKKLKNIKFYSILFFLILGLLSACSKSESEKPSNKTDGNSLTNNDNGVLIKYKSFVSFAEQQSLLKNAGLTEIFNYSFLPGLIYAEPNEKGDLLNIISRLDANENMRHFFI